MTWRDTISVHPLADQFPMMSEAELEELAGTSRRTDSERQGSIAAPVLFISSTPSDVRAIKNTAAMARRVLR
jgi:hypothetical protein